MSLTVLILIITIIVSLIGGALVVANVTTLSQGRLEVTRVFRDLIIGFVLLEVSAIAVSLILLALVLGWYVNYLETAFDVVALIAIALRAFVIFYAWRVYRFLKPNGYKGEERKK